MSKATPVPAAQPGFFALLKATVKSGVSTIVARVKQAFNAIRERVQTAKAHTTAAIQTVKSLVPLRRFAAAVSVVVATISYAAPQGFSEVVSGIGGAVIAGAVQTYGWLRRSARSVGLLG